ncbi:unnamed protein product [Aspergillus oryzae]|uniref:Unnamed protein product n=1 Tax=Aspergillus oryzae var. brunneus TaxID=332754 RepID=A0ABQ6KAG2_ASPOZ|nr:unnamed protein product [Aspergillus oryzae]GMF94058.1 unnamed protein product [Aspergillus oryzae]GMG07997.1 unnamed protein product [Aspergillus oryzae]GMG41509.1 unnamed protein product [Aspergillus oryzae var. brunneus]
MSINVRMQINNLDELLGDVACVVPFNLALDILYVLKLVAQLDHREADHPGIEAEGSADSHLYGAGSIEAHNEVVTFRVSGLVLCGGLGESEGAPVGVSADYAAGAQDLNAGITGDSEKS